MAERCPQCHQRLGRDGGPCPRCGVVDDLPTPSERTDPTQDLGPIRQRLLPGADLADASPPSASPPPKGRDASGRLLTEPLKKLPSLDRLIHVIPHLRQRNLNFSPYESWVLSLVDGRSSARMLAPKLGLETVELQFLLRNLEERGAIAFGEKIDPPKIPAPSLREVDEAPTVASTDALDPQVNEPTRLIPSPARPPSGPARAATPARPSSGAARAARPPSGPARTVNPARPPSAPTLAEGNRARPQSREAATMPVMSLEVLRLIAEGSGPQPAPAPPLGRLSTTPAQRALPEPSRPRSKGAERASPARPASRGATTPGRRLPNREEEEATLTEDTRPPLPASAAAPRPRSRSSPVVRKEPVRPAVEPARPAAEPPRPARASMEVPRPTVGIEDVDAQGALQVASQMEQTGRFEEAVAYLERALERFPDAAPLFNRLALILMRDFADYDRAEELMQRALELSPKHPVFARNLQAIQQRQNELKRRRR